MRKLRVMHWLCVIVMMLSVGIAGAQTMDGTLRGEVTDPSGAVVAGAKVTATNVATNVSGETTTSASGTYNFPNLLPGMYTVTVEIRRIRRNTLANRFRFARTRSQKSVPDWSVPGQRRRKSTSLRAPTSSKPIISS